MNKPAKIFSIVAVLLVLAGVVMFGLRQPQEVEPILAEQPMPVMPLAPTDTASPPALSALPASASAPQYPIDVAQPTPLNAAEKPPRFPSLGDSDDVVRLGLLEFIANKNVLAFLQLGQFVRHVVATVDSLPSEHVSPLIWPINPMPGHFSTGQGNNIHPAGLTTIHPGNDARYVAFINFVSQVDTAAAVAFYVRLYPLFQQAYQELGYPHAYFNDRLVEVIDHLLAAPVQMQPLEVSRVEVKGPYRPVRPWITYEFTDPALRDLSAGQKMLLRAGAVNHQRLRTKLMAIRARLTKNALLVREQPT